MTSEETVTVLTDLFLKDVWSKCLPTANDTSEDRLAKIKTDPALFLSNMMAMSEYLLLDVIGEFRADRGGAVLTTIAQKVLVALEKQSTSIASVGLKGWALTTVGWRLREMLGMPTPEPVKSEPTPKTAVKLKVAKGWKVRRPEDR